MHMHMLSHVIYSPLLCIHMKLLTISLSLFHLDVVFTSNSYCNKQDDEHRSKCHFNRLSQIHTWLRNNFSVRSISVPSIIS